VQPPASNIRPGWIVAAFAGVAFATEAVLALIGTVFHLFPERLALDQPGLLINSLLHLTAALAATVVAWFMGQEPGLGRPRTILPGLLIGAVLLTVSVVISGLFGGTLGISDCDHKLRSAAFQLVLLGPAALAEELLLRGAAFRALARAINPPVAIVGGGLVFGVLHLANPDASPVAAANVALVGIFFGSLAWRAQSLWPAFGAHLAWNGFEGFVFGQNVSGIRAGCSLFTATARAPFFGGGDFGPEASGVTCLVLIVACAGAAFWPRRSTFSHER
jgi:membrane protease YdiL (CAAX protease family)